MNKHQKALNGETDSPGSGRGLEPAAIDTKVRRRLLLKGLGKGSAIIAAAVPIKTLAVTNSVTQNGLMCTVSGVGSAAHSQSGGVAACGGLSPGWYKTPSHWPNYNSGTNKATNTVGSKTFYEDFGGAPNGKASGGPINQPSTKDTAFNAIFGAGSTAGIFYILKNQAPTDEFHWIAALLNSILYATTGQWPKSPYVFPYSPAEVLSLYTNNNAGGIAFFGGYMETL